MADLLDFIGFGKFSVRGNSSRLFYFIPLTFFSIYLFAGVSLKAQEEIIPTNLAPPVVKAISKEEKTALAAVTDIKDRTKLALDLMEARLKKAEALYTQESYNATLVELGGFHALMDDAIRYLNSNNNGGGKAMNNFKKFEMALRAFMPRIEIIRRDLPERFEYHVRTLLITVRDTRAKAVEPFFSTTILPAGN
jgi:hypothetical protein